MRTACLAVLLLAVSCGPDSAALAVDGDELGDDLGLEVALGELDATKLLQFVNSVEATAVLLREEVGLDSRAATGLVARRDGVDGQFGTGDDRLFASIAEVDAVPWVGTAALAKLDTYASRPGVTPGAITLEGIAFTTREAADALATVNGPLLDRVTLSTSARESLRSKRPFADLAGVAAAPSIGPTALTAIRSAVRANPITTPSGACIGTGGSYDGVAFTKDEECRAVAFMNQARFSEMGALPAAGRLALYLAGPDGVWRWKRTSAWGSVSAFSNFTGMGTTAISALKSASTTWTPGGATSDTVASTWANRATLVNGPVLFEQVSVVRVLPEIYGDGGYTWQCAELRDSATASNYVYGCYPHFTCEGGDCWGANAAGSTRLVYGTLRRTTLAGFGGYRISLGGR